MISFYIVGILQMKVGLSSNDSLQAVCYSLRGSFRGEDIIMRGCDALPLSNPDESGRQCLDNFKIWFVTEVGKEYITDHKLCICNEDFCNFDYDLSGAVLIKSSVILLFIYLFISLHFKKVSIN